MALWRYLNRELAMAWDSSLDPHSMMALVMEIPLAMEIPLVMVIPMGEGMG